MKLLHLFLAMTVVFLGSISMGIAKTIDIPGKRAVITVVNCDCDIDGDGDGEPEKVDLLLLRCEGIGPYCIRIFIPDNGPLARAELYDDGQLTETKTGVYCGPGPSGDPNTDAYFYEVP